MTDAIAFDTHRFVKRLTECGFTERQAETLADEQVALLNGNLATKADIAKVEAALKADIAKVEAALKADIAKVEAALKADIARVEGDLAKVEAALKADITKVEGALKADIARVEGALKADIAKVEGKIEASRSDLLKWMVGALIAQGALVVALVKLL